MNHDHVLVEPAADGPQTKAASTEEQRPEWLDR